MAALTAGCISLDKAFERLGPLLIGKDWIPELTPHELWLLQRDRAAQIRDDGFIVPIKTLAGPRDERPEVSAARDRLEEGMWQRGRCKAWLRKRGLVRNGENGGSVVDLPALEAMLAEEFGPAPRVPRGRKPGQHAKKNEMTRMALEILEKRTKPRRRGRLREIAREVREGRYPDYTVDAVERNIRPGVRAWEAKYPDQ